MGTDRPDREVLIFLQVPRDPGSGFVPVYPGPVVDYWTHKEDFEARYEVVPFKRAFPLELFLAIIAQADLSAIALAARASLGCYNLLMPLLLETVIAGSEESYLAKFWRRLEVSPRSSSS